MDEYQSLKFLYMEEYQSAKQELQSLLNVKLSNGH